MMFDMLDFVVRGEGDFLSILLIKCPRKAGCVSQYSYYIKGERLWSPHSTKSRGIVPRSFSLTWADFFCPKANSPTLPISRSVFSSNVRMRQHHWRTTLEFSIPIPYTDSFCALSRDSRTFFNFEQFNDETVKRLKDDGWFLILRLCVTGWNELNSFSNWNTCAYCSARMRNSSETFL